MMMRLVFLTIVVLLYFSSKKIKISPSPYILIWLPVIAYVTIFFMSEECVILLFVLVIMIIVRCPKSLGIETQGQRQESFSNSNIIKDIKMTVSCEDIKAFKESACTDSVYDDSNYNNNNNNRRLVTLAEHTSDHGRQTNSSTEEKGEQV